MKEIKTYVREEKLEAVIRALRAAGARAVTAVRVVPLGSEVDAAFIDISSARPITQYPPMVTLELVCPDADAATYVQVISSGALTGHRGDGAIFVSAVEEAVHIRTGTRGEAAL